MELDLTPRRSLLASGGGGSSNGGGSTRGKSGRPRGSKNKNPTSSLVKNYKIPPRLDRVGINHGTKTTAAAATAEEDEDEEEEGLPVPNHPIFKCRWKCCGAELHNLTTLRKHIEKVHRLPDEVTQEIGFPCWWKRCRYLREDVNDDDPNDGDGDGDGDGGRRGNVLFIPPHTFGTVKDWLDHINEDHLSKVAMKLGDGPDSSLIDSRSLHEQKIRYLSDEHGGIVSPSVSQQHNPDIPPDAMIFTKPVGDKPEATAQKAFMKVHRPNEKANELPKSTAEEILRAMEARKTKIGPGVERGGCTLVNEARRNTFIQNPAIRRVVHADY